MIKTTIKQRKIPISACKNLAATFNLTTSNYQIEIDNRKNSKNSKYKQRKDSCRERK